MLGVGQSPPVERHRGARPWMRIDAGRQVDPVAVAKFTLRGLKAPAVPGPAIAHASAHSSAAARSRLSAISIRSEEHTSELQSLMRISYAVFCLKKKKRREQ